VLVPDLLKIMPKKVVGKDLKRLFLNKEDAVLCGNWKVNQSNQSASIYFFNRSGTNARFSWHKHCGMSVCCR